MCVAAGVIGKISTGLISVRGITSLDGELFVMMERHDNQVAVYSIDDYKLLHHLDVPQYEPFVHFDMTSCVRRRCLYMFDINNSCIHKHVLSSSATSRWPVSFKPVGLSVTPNGNLLATARGPNKLVELSAESGEQVREIALQWDIELPWHGVQLASGQFAVCHGVLDKELYRVCLVGDDGRVTRSYGGKMGSGDGHLNDPRHLAVDEDSAFEMTCIVSSGALNSTHSLCG